MKSFLFFLIFSLVIVSCDQDDSELPEPELAEEQQEEGNEQPVVTYTNFTKSMIENNSCLMCHFDGYRGGPPAAGRDLRTYEGVRDVVINGSLQRLAIDGISPTMPLNLPELSDPIKDTLQMWIDQGALE